MKKLILFVLILLLAFVQVTLAQDKYGPTGQESPAVGDYAITPSDTTVLSPVPRGVYIGVGGDLTVILKESGTAVTYVGVPQGTIFPIRPRIVLSTGTTAASLNAMY